MTKSLSSPDIRCCGKSWALSEDMSAEIVYSLNKIVHSTKSHINRTKAFIKRTKLPFHQTKPVILDWECVPTWERHQGTSTQWIWPSIRAGTGDLAEGEPFRLLFRFRGGPNLAWQYSFCISKGLWLHQIDTSADYYPLLKLAEDCVEHWAQIQLR